MLRRRGGEKVRPPSMMTALLLVGISFGAASCALLPAPGDQAEREFSGKGNAKELIRGLAQRVHQFRSLRSLATIYYWGADERAGFQEVIVVQRPSRLRLETLSPLGAILIVTADADEIIGFHPREGLFYRGKTTRENLLRYTRIPLEMGELTSLLMGLPPLAGAELWDEEGTAIYRMIAGGGRDRITFHPTLPVPAKWERIGPGGEIEFAALFSEFSPTAAGLFPMKILLEAQRQQRRVEIRYQEPELNVALPFDLFVQEKPGHIRELPIESLGG